MFQKLHAHEKQWRRLHRLLLFLSQIFIDFVMNPLTQRRFRVETLRGQIERIFATDIKRLFGRKTFTQVSKSVFFHPLSTINCLNRHPLFSGLKWKKQQITQIKRAPVKTAPKNATMAAAMSVILYRTIHSFQQELMAVPASNQMQGRMNDRPARGVVRH